MMSLRLRLLLGAIAGISVTLTMAAFIMVTAFQRHVRERYVEELNSHLHQLAALVQVDSTGAVSLRHELYDGTFQQPLSGLYWQVNEAGRSILRSKSLWDNTLDLGSMEPSVSQRQVDDIVGPRKQRLIAVERSVNLDAGEGRRLQLAVAGESRVVDESRREFVTTVSFSLAVIGGLLALASWLQVRAGLAPLRNLGRQLEALRQGVVERLEGRFPHEIADIVDALNRLLTTQSKEVERARANAGKLGHGLKTPLAVLATESRALRRKGDADAARSIEQEIDEMNAQIARVIAAARSVGPRQAVGTSTEIEPVLRRMIDVMKRLPRGTDINWSLEVSPSDLSVPIDQRDVDELVGNVLDNARKWANGRVQVDTSSSGDLIRIIVHDDGPGIPEDRLEDVLHGGFRLDRTVPGTGIGLAIASDLAKLHRGELKIGPSELGGTAVSITLGNQFNLRSWKE